MNYLEISKKYWNLIHAEAPPFVRKRIACLVKAGYLQPAGTSTYRSTYFVIGGRDEYERGGDLLIESMV